MSKQQHLILAVLAAIVLLSVIACKGQSKPYKMPEEVRWHLLDTVHREQAALAPIQAEQLQIVMEQCGKAGLQYGINCDASSLNADTGIVTPKPKPEPLPPTKK